MIRHLSTKQRSTTTFQICVEQTQFVSAGLSVLKAVIVSQVVEHSLKRTSTVPLTLS